MAIVEGIRQRIKVPVIQAGLKRKVGYAEQNGDKKKKKANTNMEGISFTGEDA
jgi:hypothetical protein